MTKKQRLLNDIAYGVVNGFSLRNRQSNDETHVFMSSDIPDGSVDQMVDWMRSNKDNIICFVLTVVESNSASHTRAGDGCRYVGERRMCRLFTTLAACPNLQSVKLTSRTIRSTRTVLPCNIMRPFERLVASSSSLVSLYIGDPNVSCSHFVQLFQALERNTCLRRLQIRTSAKFNSLDIPDRVEAVANMLRRNSTLEGLSMYQLSLSSPIVKALGESNRGLRVLDLQWGFSFRAPEFESAVMKLLKENEVLECITGSYVWESKLIPVHFRLRQAGLLAYLRHRPLTWNEGMHATTRKDWVDAIVNSRHDVKTVYYLLSKKPALCLGCNAKTNRVLAR